MSGKIVPFGKYKGQPVEVMAADREYCEWAAAQPWFRDRFRDVYNVVINYGTEPQDTPEHNELQARFLDHDFCLAVLARVKPEWLDLDIAFRADTWRLEEREKAEIVRDEPIKVNHVSFEVSGWDVAVSFSGGRQLCTHGHYSGGFSWHYGPEGNLLIECKPVIGDDYPSVLRQVKRYRVESRDACAVLMREFCASTVPLASVRRIFAASGCVLVLESECR